jgi:dethiobiotin synthetase
MSGTEVIVACENTLEYMGFTQACGVLLVIVVSEKLCCINHGLLLSSISLQ